METILTISTQGGIVILAVAVLRLLLKKAPKRFICLLWLLAGLRLLLPFQIESNLSLQPNYNQGSVWEGAQTIVAPEDHSASYCRRGVRHYSYYGGVAHLFKRCDCNACRHTDNDGVFILLKLGLKL